MKQRRKHPFCALPTPTNLLPAILVSFLVIFCLLQKPALGQTGCPCDTPSSPPPPEMYPPPSEVYPSPPPPPKHKPPKDNYPQASPGSPDHKPAAAGTGCCVVIPQGPLYVLDPSFRANGAAAAPAATWVARSALQIGLVLGFFWLLL